MTTMSFFAELKNRNVLRVAAAYTVVAWLVIQIVETIFPVYGLSDAAIRLVIMLLAIGLIPVVVFAWAFELTPEGFKKEKDIDRSQLTTVRTAKTLDRVIMIVLALALAYFAFDKFVLSESREASIAETARQEGRTEALVESYGDQSIAVLPFVNMSSDPEQAYFADGISEELLNLLAKIPQLRVTSRSSAFAFRGDDINIPEVAEKLNVAYILEGSVRKAGNQVRITVQLIEARSDTHLWSETYDRPLDDIFAIQDDVAAKVVDQLRITLLGELPKATRANVLAYALYLQAKQIVKLQIVDEFPKAEAMLKRALEIDPTYVDALVELMLVYSSPQIESDWKERDELRVLYFETRDSILALDPDNPKLNAIIALEKIFNNEPVAAAKLLEAVLAIDPSNLKALFGSALVASDLGKFDLAIRIYEYLAERDPLNLWIHWNLGWTYLVAGRIEDALHSHAIAISLNPDAESGRWKSGLIKLVAGDPAGALADFELEIHAPYRLHGTILALHDLGREEESAAALRELLDVQDNEKIWPYGLARLYAWLGNADEAFRFMRLATEVYPGSVGDAATNPLYQKLHDDPRWHEVLLEIGAAPEQLAAIEFNVALPE
ncbi:MAG: tetratricopeptide repeat protein [Proteobacteria bacterium]|nr:tetratricopeptide repeat protein [Pseudomonadota bacterium]